MSWDHEMRTCSRDRHSGDRLRVYLSTNVFFVAVFVFFFLWSGPDAMPAAQDSLIRKGIHLSLLQDYAKAESLFALLPPDNPARYFFRAMLQHSRMVFENDFANADRFGLYCRQTIEKALPQPGVLNEAEAQFFKGCGWGAMSAYEEKTGMWLACFLHGRKAVRALRLCMEKSPGYYDALAGIGIYQYWKGKVTQYLRWLPFLSDEREAGRKSLRLAMEKGKYLSDAARFSLIWVYYSENDPARSLALTEEFLRRFPANTIFLRAQADLLLRMGRWQEAANGYQGLLSILGKRPTASRFQEIECSFKMAKAWKAAGAKDKAVEAFKRALTFRYPPRMEGVLGPLRREAEENLRNLGVRP